MHRNGSRRAEREVADSGVDSEPVSAIPPSCTRSLRPGSSDPWFGALFECVDEAAVLLDRWGRILRANPAFERILGRCEADLAGTRLAGYLAPGCEALFDVYLAAPAPYGPARFPLLVQPSAEEIPRDLDATAHRPPEAGGGTLLVCRAACRSVDPRTERRELHHRVKNHLQIISSMLRRQAQATKDPRLGAILAECECRVQTLGLIHDLLGASPATATVDVSQLAKRLARIIGATHNTTAEISVRVPLPETRLDADQAATCGLILNELLSNSFRHAFAGRTAGTVEIAGSVRDDLVEIRVSDDGVGLPADSAVGRHAGLGLDLVHGLVRRQLDGTYRYLSIGPGTTFVFRFRRALPSRSIA